MMPRQIDLSEFESFLFELDGVLTHIASPARYGGEATLR